MFNLRTATYLRRKAKAWLFWWLLPIRPCRLGNWPREDKILGYCWSSAHHYLKNKAKLTKGGYPTRCIQHQLVTELPDWLQEILIFWQQYKEKRKGACAAGTTCQCLLSLLHGSEVPEVLCFKLLLFFFHQSQIQWLFSTCYTFQNSFHTHCKPSRKSHKYMAPV